MNPKEVLDFAKDKYFTAWNHYVQRQGDPILALGPTWANNNITSVTQNWLAQSKDAIELILRAQDTHMYTSYIPVDGRNDVIGPNVDWQLERLNYDYFTEPEEIQEWEHTRQEHVAVRKGRRLTSYMLRLLAIAHSVSTAMPIKGSKILELGAGCGHQARYMMLKGCKQYVIVDIPETLCYSFSLLKMSFPNKKVVFAANEGDITDDFDILLLPTVHLHKMHGKNFDLFINTASMGEMNNTIVRHYFDFVQNKANFKYLYTLNRFLNYGRRPDENECSVLYDNKWEMLKWQLEPEFCRCPYLDSFHSRYVEILAKRIPTSLPASIAERLVQEVALEDWCRHPWSHPRYHYLDADLGMTGTLFKLWEALRINPTKRAYELMCQFIEVYKPGIELEEYDYYVRKRRETN
jgi:hypothetical protein